MKRVIYITAFIILGVLLQFLIHGFVETWYVNLLVRDYATYSLGLSWDDWYLVHDIAVIILALAGLIFGFLQGRYWWKKIYILGKWHK
jgi:hypothetical protein